MNLHHEVKRRKVFRVAAVGVATAIVVPGPANLGTDPNCATRRCGLGGGESGR